MSKRKGVLSWEVVIAEVLKTQAAGYDEDSRWEGRVLKVLMGNPADSWPYVYLIHHHQDKDIDSEEFTSRDSESWPQLSPLGSRERTMVDEGYVREGFFEIPISKERSRTYSLEQVDAQTILWAQIQLGIFERCWVGGNYTAKWEPQLQIRCLER